MTLYGWRQGVVAFGALVTIWLGWNPNARFESSDGAWWDSTINFKDRDFIYIKREFQEYQTKCKKPTAILVRTTSINPLAVTSWPWYLLKPEWRVPYLPAQKLKNEAAGSRRPLGGEVVCPSDTNNWERSQPFVVAEPPRADHPILGAWSVTSPRNSCVESGTYGTDGRYRSAGAQEIAVSEYSIAAQPSEKGFYKVVDVVVQTNGLPDCRGNVIPIGDVATFYVRFGDGNSGFMICAQESMDFCYAAARRSPTT